MKTSRRKDVGIPSSGYLFSFVAGILVCLFFWDSYCDFHTSPEPKQSFLTEAKQSLLTDAFPNDVPMPVPASSLPEKPFLPSGLSLKLLNRRADYMMHYFRYKNHYWHSKPLLYEGFPERAYCYLLTHESLLRKLLISEMSFRAVHSAFPRIVLVTPNVMPYTRRVLLAMNMLIIELPTVISIPKSFSRPYVGKWINAIYKFELFRITQAKRLVSIDVDTILLKNIDALFDNQTFPNEYYYAPDNWECYEDDAKVNSGLQILTPSMDSYYAVNAYMANSTRYFSQGDQQVFQEYYRASPLGPKLKSLGERYHAFWRRCKCQGHHNTSDWHLIHMTPRDPVIEAALFHAVPLPDTFLPCAIPWVQRGRAMYVEAMREVWSRGFNLDFVSADRDLKDIAWLTAKVWSS